MDDTFINCPNCTEDGVTLLASDNSKTRTCPVCGYSEDND